MGSEWQTCTLKEAGVQLIDCDHKTPKAQESGFPYIGIPQMKEGNIDFDANPRLISQSDLDTWTKKAKPQTNDVILSRRCNSGETVHVGSRTEFALGQNLVILRSVGERVFPPYLRWVVRSPHWWAEVGKYLNPGAIFESLKCADIPKFKIPLPPLHEQKAIAHILGSLDDKIELNRRMNATLEGMAQALFKSWFVDFDPVIDNALAAGNPIPDELAPRAEVRRQALADGTANREAAKPFPAAFQETETMGWIPEGWETGKITDLADLNSESWSNKSHPDHVNYVDLANTKNGRINEVFPYDYSDAPSRARRVLRVDDTIIGTVRPGNRSFAYVHEGGLTGSTGFAVLRPKQEACRSYVYLRLTQDDVIDHFAHLADGGAYPAIRPEVVGNLETVTFPQELMELFDQKAYPLIEKIGQHQRATASLNKLRDTLLPKLISGEVRIPETEKLTEEALA